VNQIGEGENVARNTLHVLELLGNAIVEPFTNLMEPWSQPYRTRPGMSCSMYIFNVIVFVSFVPKPKGTLSLHYRQPRLHSSTFCNKWLEWFVIDVSLLACSFHAPSFGFQVLRFQLGQLVPLGFQVLRFQLGQLVPLGFRCEGSSWVSSFLWVFRC
jgi:hypothetical protein